MSTSEKRRRVLVEADFWKNLLASLPDSVDEIVRSTLNFQERVLEYIDDILLYGNDWERYKVDSSEIAELREKLPYAGVDSSLTPPQRVGPYLLSAISAVLVLTEGACSNPRRYLGVKVAKAPEEADAQRAVNEIKLNMFEFETVKINEGVSALLRETEGKGVILVDGPIVDPPNFTKKPQDLRERYERYIESRSRAISFGSSKGLTIVGIAKKITGNFLVEHIAEYIKSTNIDSENLVRTINDYTLVTLLLKSKKLINLLTSICKDEDMILATKPIELSEASTDYSIYKKFGLYVFHFYLFPSVKDYSKKRILRLEIAFDHAPTRHELLDGAWRAAKVVAAACPPRLSIPAPILIAHKACTIPRSTARVIMKEIISKYLTSFYKQRSENIETAIDLSLNLLD